MEVVAQNEDRRQRKDAWDPDDLLSDPEPRPALTTSIPNEQFAQAVGIYMPLCNLLVRLARQREDRLVHATERGGKKAVAVGGLAALLMEWEAGWRPPDGARGRAGSRAA